MCCLSNKFKLDETFLSTLYLLKGTVEVSAHSSCKIFCTFQSQLSDNGKYGTCVHMCAKVCFLAQVMSGQKGWWKSVNGVWMHWESEEQDEQLPGDLSWVKAGEWLSHTHSVEHVGDWGRCVKCCLCVLKRFPNTYRLAHVKKKRTGPPHAVLGTMENWYNWMHLNTYGLVVSEIMVGTKVRQGRAADCFLKQCSEGYCLGYATYLRLVRPPCPWLSTSTIQPHCKLHQMYTCTYAFSWSF